MPSKVWDEITYPFVSSKLKLRNGWFHPTLYNGCNYLSMLPRKLSHFSKRNSRLVFVSLASVEARMQRMGTCFFVILNFDWLIFGKHVSYSCGDHTLKFVPKGPINSSPHGQNGRHFTDDIFRCRFVNEKFVFGLKLYWNSFLRVQMTITQHWFR